ncbi:hypothetical protein OTU49_015295, partial [Cherax quadricarinatus]
ILEVYESVVTLLQDDCDAVRNSVAYGVQKLLVDQQHQSQCSLQSTRILSKVCDVIGSIGTPEALTLLVKLTLKDDLPQSFGLTQDDDRVFDKGEMNIYSEDILVGRTAAKSLSGALASWSSCTIPPVLLRSPIIPSLCALPPAQKEIILAKKPADDDDSTFLSIISFLNLLEHDISYIYEEISALTDTSVYCVKNLDLWLVKLGCRSALWRAITQYYNTKSDVITSVVAGLNNSIIKGQFLCEIIDELS